MSKKDAGIEKDIKNYLSRNGIERVSDDETWKRIHKKFNRIGWKGTSWKEFVVLAHCGLAAREIPEYYDIFQNSNRDYDYRIAFLEHMVELISSFPASGRLTSVMDSGCASGLDLCFLAEKYRNGKYRFIGYDNQEGMIELAVEREKKLGLNKVHFYVGDNARPRKKEISSADILYNNGSLGLDDERRERIIAGRISKIFSRIKTGGIGVIGGINKSDVSEVSGILKNDGIIRRESYMAFDRGCHGVYIHIFDIK